MFKIVKNAMFIEKKLYIWGICVYRERERDVKKLFHIYTFDIHTHTYIYIQLFYSNCIF